MSDEQVKRMRIALLDIERGDRVVNGMRRKWTAPELRALARDVLEELGIER